MRLSGTYRRRFNGRSGQSGQPPLNGNEKILKTLWAGIVLLSFCFSVLPCSAAVRSYNGNRGLFGSHEIRSNNLSLFPQWQRALNRSLEEAGTEKAECSAENRKGCLHRDWMGALEALRGKDRLEQIQGINRMVNARPYVRDAVNYGVSDHWATLNEFLSLNGDCEDYAIAKYFALRTLGFSPDSMRIVVLKDLSRRTTHSVLVVYLGDRALVLDNQLRAVVDARSIRHYQAVYAVNERHWWLYTP